MELLTQYFDLQKQIHAHFGYKQDWVVIPLHDEREMYWHLQSNDQGGGTVWFSDVEMTPESISTGDHLYSNVVYTQRFLPKWVYRTDEYTMICVDTRTDGNKFLSVFSNDKELTDPTPEQMEALREWIF
jgi:hypothetical protein